MVLHLQRKIKSTISIIGIVFLLSGVVAPPVFAVEGEVDSGQKSEVEQDISEAPDSSEVQPNSKTPANNVAQDNSGAPDSIETQADNEMPDSSEPQATSEEPDSSEEKSEQQSQIKINATIKVINSETGDKELWVDDVEYEFTNDSSASNIMMKMLTEKIEKEEKCRFEFDAKGRIASISAPLDGNYAGRVYKNAEGDNADFDNAEFDNGGNNDKTQCWRIVVDGKELENEKATKDYALSGGETVEFIYDNKGKTTIRKDIPLLAASKTEIDDKYGNTRDKLLKEGDETGWPYGSEFSVVGNARAGYMTEERKNTYCNNLIDELKSVGGNRLSETQSSDNAKAILALTAMEINPADIGGYNLLEPLADMTFLTRQGMNGPVWALIAFDSGNYEIPTVKAGGSQVTRDSLVDFILRAQHSDGGWAYSGSSDIDMTAMAIQALTPYYNTNSNVKNAVDKGLQWLSSNQNKDGFFTTGGVSSESQSQVIVALTGLGIDPAQDGRFVKNGNGAIDALLSFYCDGGGFKHVNSNWKANGLATVQGNYALVAYYRYINGQSALYNMGTPSDYVIDVDYNTDDKTPQPDNNDTEKEDNKEDNNADKEIKPMAKGTTKSLSLLKINQVSSANKKLGKKYHYDKPSGIDMRDNDESVLPWYIKLNVTEKNVTHDQQESIMEVLGEDSRICYSYDISFTNTIDNSKWVPKGVVNVSFKLPDDKTDNNYVVIHIGKNGRIEFIKGEIDDAKGRISFKAADFSVYALAQTPDEIDFAKEDDSINVLPWCIGGIIALVAVIAMVVLRRKLKTDEE